MNATWRKRSHHFALSPLFSCCHLRAGYLDWLPFMFMFIQQPSTWTHDVTRDNAQNVGTLMFVSRNQRIWLSRIEEKKSIISNFWPWAIFEWNYNFNGKSDAVRGQSPETISLLSSLRSRFQFQDGTLVLGIIPQSFVLFTILVD